jgi:hypothetical protein
MRAALRREAHVDAFDAARDGEMLVDRGLALTMADLGPHPTLLAANLASSFSGSLRSHFGLPTVISRMD